MKFPKPTNFEIINKEINKHIKCQNKIYEGLIYSHDPSNIFRGLKNLGYKQEQIGLEDSVNGKVFIIAFFLDKNYLDNFNKLSKFMENVCGWKLSNVKDQNGKSFGKKVNFLNSNNQHIWLQYEPKFDVEIPKDKFPNKVYHITPVNKLNKILKIGLSPKTKNNLFSYSERVYLSNNVESLLNLAKLFVKGDDKKEKEFVILEISIKLMYLRQRLFKDPNFKNGYYTLENISPKLINPIIKIELDNKGNIIKKENIW